MGSYLEYIKSFELFMKLINLKTFKQIILIITDF